MANTTFRSLVNTLLVRLNEVTIDEADFASTRGVQQLAKDAINSAIETINAKEFEWPFNANASLGSQDLTVGTEEYSFPNNTKLVKWDTFHLVADDDLGTGGHRLEYISRDQRNRYLKNDDDVSEADGRGQPRYVYPAQGFGFGVSPSPDEAYTVTFEYHLYPTRLEDHDDESAIPPAYDEAIIQGGLYHFYMFRDNSEQANMAEKQLNIWIARMRSTMINKEDRILGTFINRRRGSGNLVSDDYFLF
jgi:hypothetical protein